MNAELLENATWAARQNANGHDYQQIAAAVLRVAIEACAKIARQNGAVQTDREIRALLEAAKLYE